MLAQTGVNGVTVARGAIGNPWIFEQARALARGEKLPAAPSLWEQREVILQHFRLAEQVYGSVRCGVPMRKFGIKYSALHPQWKEVREDFTRVKDLSDWKVVLDRWYGDDSPGRHPLLEAHLGKRGCEEAA